MGTQSFQTLDSPRNCAFIHGYYDTQSLSALSTPFASAPSSPVPYWVFETEKDASYTSTQFPAVIPFSWEEKPGTPKNRTNSPQIAKRDTLSLTESEFEFSSQFSEPYYVSLCPAPASELFLNGQIRPLKPPPRLQQPLLSRHHVTAKSDQGTCFNSRGCLTSPISAPQSPCSPITRIRRSIIRRVFCGICDPTLQEFDPFAAAMEEMARSKTGKWHQLSPSAARLTDAQSSKSFQPEDFFLAQLSTGDFMQGRNDSNRSSSKNWTLKSLLYRNSPTGLERRASNSSLREEQAATDNQKSNNVGKTKYWTGSHSDSSKSVPA